MSVVQMWVMHLALIRISLILARSFVPLAKARFKPLMLGSTTARIGVDEDSFMTVLHGM